MKILGKNFQSTSQNQILSEKFTLWCMFSQKFIREQNLCHIMLKLEQAGESLHCTLNRIEKHLDNVKNKPLRYWCLLKEYENILKCDMSNFIPKRRKTTQKKNKNRRLSTKKNFTWKKVNLSKAEIVCLQYLLI